ncbi:MAG: HAMP domain-containing histidine kinase [Acidimicrobiia bacterium]|nr:HAMP domain-containing histidine kinase [Acidimicrobiia bacterium]MDH5236434.1 HAMP domain-containing histidine kinase [Acidimicrobiia bacterium]
MIDSAGEDRTGEPLRSVHFGQRIAEKLPSWMGSVRVRLTGLYSLILFGLAAVVVFGIYTGLANELDEQRVYRRAEIRGLVPLEGGGALVVGGEQTVVDPLALFEQEVNREALDRLRRYSAYSLGFLFVASLGVGWFVSGMVLHPIGRITQVARDIGATDMKRRIRLRGPNDELRQLADTFDDMLERLDHAFENQRDFIQETSHELRNPLAVIRTNLELLEADSEASLDDYREVAALVGRTAERMSTLVDDLLLYARQEIPDRSAVVDLADVVADVAAEYGALAEAEGIQLLVSAPPGHVVHGDAVGLRRALANLLANAVRHTPTAGRVRVAAGREPGWVWVAVEDSGPGIAAADHGRVFQRFWRGGRRQSAEPGRSGLGLSIVRQIMEAHGGEVRLVSVEGHGSTFSLWLPDLSDRPPGDRPSNTGEIRLPTADHIQIGAADE